jgi:hypothetical protein
LPGFGKIFASPNLLAVFDQADERIPMTAIALKNITIYPVVEQQGPFFDVMEFFPTLTKELLEENRSWLEPTFIDPATGRLGCVCKASSSRHHTTIFSLIHVSAITNRGRRGRSGI